MGTTPLPKPSLRLSDVEWDIGSILRDVPDWQLIAMLNYEFARCYAPLLREVERIRRLAQSSETTSNRSPKKSSLSFAQYLAQFFGVEFPGTPWGEIDKQVRRERLSDLGINEENGLYASPPPAWVALEIMGEGPSHTPKQLAKLPDFLRESYGVFKLDFWQADEEIAEQFLKWLSHRRSTLIEKYDDPVELQPGQIANTAALFCEHKPLPTAVGRGHKKMRCKDLIKDLGRVRFWTYAGGTLDQIDKVCQALGSNPVSRSSRRYFSDLQNIRRAEVRVGETILNLATAWNQPGDVFREIDNPRVIDHPFPGTTYKAPKKAPDKSAIINARKVLEEHFILKSLKTEPIH